MIRAIGVVFSLLDICTINFTVNYARCVFGGRVYSACALNNGRIKQENYFLSAGAPRIFHLIACFCRNNAKKAQIHEQMLLIQFCLKAGKHCELHHCFGFSTPVCIKTSWYNFSRRRENFPSRTINWMKRVETLHKYLI